MTVGSYLKRQAREAVRLYFRPIRILWRLLTSVPCKEMLPDEDGWSDWVHPLPGYLMKCCDCSLVHEMETAIVEAHEEVHPTSEGEDDGHIIIFRMRRG